MLDNTFMLDSSNKQDYDLVYEELHGKNNKKGENFKRQNMPDSKLDCLLTKFHRNHT